MNLKQEEQVRNHLQAFGKITSWEAIEKYHITRLAQYILLLRRKGFDIRSDNKKHNGKHFVEYVLQTKTEPSGQLAMVI